MVRLVEVSDVFSRMEVKKEDLIKTSKIRPDDYIEGYGPHMVRLPKGAIPDYIKLTPYQEFCWRTMGRVVKFKAKENPDLEDNLLKAHMKIRPEEYIAYVWMTTIIVSVVAVIAAIALSALLFALAGSIKGIIIGVIIVVVLPVMTYFILLRSPGSKAKGRAVDIDKKLPAAMSFISAMASANVNVDVIFKELSRQNIYGQIKEEAEWITRDTELLGVDILTALKKAAIRTPSTKFQDFIQGVVTTSSSGGELKPYFLVKAEQYEKEARLEMKGTMETLGMLAESFVTVVVAFPLFLVVILAIMGLVGGNAAFTLKILYAVVGLMIPLSQFGFIFVIWNMSQE